MPCLAHTHKISERSYSNLLVCPMKYVQCWSYLSTVTTDGRYAKIFTKREKWEKNPELIVKLSTLYTNTIKAPEQR